MPTSAWTTDTAARVWTGRGLDRLRDGAEAGAFEAPLDGEVNVDTPVLHHHALEHRNAQPGRPPDIDNSHCRADQRDRVLTGVKARRCAPPPLRGGSGLDTGSAHGHRPLCPTAEKPLFKKGGGHQLTP